jgi:outer membrane protein
VINPSLRLTAFIFLLTVIAIPSAASAQESEVLTLEEAIRTGIENNFGIRISRNLQQQAENNYSIGNAGFLPSLEASATRTERVEDSQFESANGDSQTNNGARSSSTSAGINLNWTIFDGMQMFASYNRLGALKEISDRELRFDIENLVTDIVLTYFNVIRISEQIRTLSNNIDVSLERIDIEEAKVEIGSGSEYELLQARTDLNADRAALIRENNVLTETKILLNRLLSRDPGTDFSVNREIDVNRFLSREELFVKLMEDNAELSIARMQQEVSRLELKEIQGERYPQISLSSGYTYSRNQNDGGFFRLNETTGFSVGVTARINLFNGFDTSRRVQNAQINRKNAELALESQQLALESDFLARYRAYQNSIELVDLEEQNLENADETLEIAIERFRLGTISSLEFREAQRTFVAAESRLTNAKYDAKVAETELLRLSGEIDGLLSDQAE